MCSMMAAPRAPCLRPSPAPFAFEQVPEFELPTAKLSLSGAPVLKPAEDPVFLEPLPDLELPESLWSLDAEEHEEVFCAEPEVLSLKAAPSVPQPREMPPSAPRLRPRAPPVALEDIPEFELAHTAVSCSGAPCLRPCCNPEVFPALSPFSLPMCAFDVTLAREGRQSSPGVHGQMSKESGAAGPGKLDVPRSLFPALSSPRSTTVGDDRSELEDGESLIFYLEDEASFDFTRLSSVDESTSLEELFAQGDDAASRASPLQGRSHAGSDLSEGSFIMRKDFGFGPSKKLSSLSSCSTVAPASLPRSVDF
eukprot:TRINITY_DN101090_c0_g1_i1.p1 TRINITY_DN101090_c0_g1~~TRINITY_DN101090_c0_g1_i1.p1  ORF type:complete len:309 (+),score=44.43 TRINITY_DN101090_c0_g1_i1:114-1040(+)